MATRFIDTADLVAITTINGEQHVLLVERNWPPYEAHLALPGGHVDPGEDILTAAVRELAEETNVPVHPDALCLVGEYATPGRDPRGPYRTTAYRALLDSAATPIAAGDARAARWIPTRKLADVPLAFDHRDILSDAALTER